MSLGNCQYLRDVSYILLILVLKIHYIFTREAVERESSFPHEQLHLNIPRLNVEFKRLTTILVCLLKTHIKASYTIFVLSS